MRSEVVRERGLGVVRGDILDEKNVIKQRKQHVKTRHSLAFLLVRVSPLRYGGWTSIRGSRGTVGGSRCTATFVIFSSIVLLATVVSIPVSAMFARFPRVPFPLSFSFSFPIFVPVPLSFSLSIPRKILPSLLQALPLAPLFLSPPLSLIRLRVRMRI